MYGIYKEKFLIFIVRFPLADWGGHAKVLIEKHIEFRFLNCFRKVKSILLLCTN